MDKKDCMYQNKTHKNQCFLDFQNHQHTFSKNKKYFELHEKSA